MRKVLKVKYRHLKVGVTDNYIVLDKHLVVTVVKHSYTKVQIDGKVYQLEKFYPFKVKGWLPTITVKDYYDVWRDSKYYKDTYEQW